MGQSTCGSAPNEAAVAGLVGPDGQRAADDQTARKRTEVAAVHAVRDIEVHEEDLVIADAATAPPDRHLAASIVALARVSNGRAISDDVEAVAADGLSGQCKDAFHHRHAHRQVAPIGHELGDERRRRDGDKLGHVEIVGRLHEIEPGRHAGTGVPDQRLRWIDERRRTERDAEERCRQNGGDTCHQPSTRRLSQA